MVQNSFLQKIFLTLLFGCCAAGAVEFYKNIIWQANEEVNGGYNKIHEATVAKKAAR